MKRNYNSTNSVAKIKKLSGDSVLILLFLLVVFSVYNVDFLADIDIEKTTDYKPNNTLKILKSKSYTTTQKKLKTMSKIFDLPCSISLKRRNDEILKAASKLCKNFNASAFANDKSFLGTTTQGRLGSQMIDFATRYSLNIMAGGKLRVSLDETQFRMLAPIFPYFEKYAENHLINFWYCQPEIFLEFSERLDNIENSTPLHEIQQEMVKIGKDFHHGHALYVFSDTGLPLVFKPQYNELRENVFKIRKCYLDKAQEIIDKIWSIENQNFSVIIGIHVRLTDYHHHLENLYNATILKPRFYEKAIDYFKAKYENPLFIVISDDEREASELVLQPQKNQTSIYFAGTVEQAKSGTLTTQDSIGIDLALLAQCDHVITSEGTFGQWGALLASNESIHIKGLVYDKEKELAKVIEVEALKKANMSNFLFMDDL